MTPGPLLKVECHTCRRGFDEVPHLYSTTERTLICGPCRRAAPFMTYVYGLTFAMVLLAIGGWL